MIENKKCLIRARVEQNAAVSTIDEQKSVINTVSNAQKGRGNKNAVLPNKICMAIYNSTQNTNTWSESFEIGLAF